MFIKVGYYQVQYLNFLLIEINMKISVKFLKKMDPVDEEKNKLDPR